MTITTRRILLSFISVARESASRLADALSISGADAEAVMAARRAVAALDSVTLSIPAPKDCQP